MHPKICCFVLLLISLFQQSAFAQASSIARIAVVSNPYITSLQPDQIKDENGRKRDFLAKSAPDGLQKTVDLVNALQPDALVVLGSLTWTGSEADLKRLGDYLKL